MWSLGVSASRLRAADVAHPFHGAVDLAMPSAAGSEIERVEARCRQLLPLFRPGWAFSHRTAAILLGGAMPASRGSALDIAVPRPRTPPRRRGVIGHQTAAFGTIEVRGLPLTAPIDTWLHLAATLALDDLVALGDSLLPARRRSGRIDLDELAWTVASTTDRHGMPAARRAIGLLRPGVDSRAETLLRRLLVRSGLPEPMVSPAVPVGRGIVLHPDLGYPDLRLGIEYEGEHHRLDPVQWARDLERRELFGDVDWRNVYVTKTQLFSRPRDVADRVRRLIVPR